uniref:SGNH hydrolase-type esterase domain-containing protein n=1 Tax=Anabas testudineus TaxID=64144 RepID=A0AAQ6IM46_ANATE
MRHVKLARPLGAPAAVVRCIPGARVPDIEGNLRALGQHSFSKIVIHAGANDIRLRQSEVTKNNFKEVFKLAKAMSEVVIFSGPLPMRRGDITYSRLWSLNRWMSRVPDIEGNLRALGQHSFSKIVIHAGANDIRLRQSEVTKNNFKEVFKLAKAM